MTLSFHRKSKTELTSEWTDNTYLITEDSQTFLQTELEPVAACHPANLLCKTSNFSYAFMHSDQERVLIDMCKQMGVRRMKVSAGCKPTCCQSSCENTAQWKRRWISSQ